MPLLPYLDAGTAPAVHVVQQDNSSGLRAVGSALQEVSRASQQIKSAYQRSELQRALAESAADLATAQDEIFASGDFQGAEEAFAKALAKQQSKAQGFQGEYGNEFSTRLSTYGAGELLRVRDWARQQQAGAVRANTKIASEKWAGRFADTGDTADLDRAYAAIEEAFADKALTPEQRVAARDDVLTRAAMDRAAVLIQRDPVAAEREFRTGAFWNEVPEAVRARAIEAAQAEAAERQRVALQQMQWENAQKIKEDVAHDNENFHRVIDMGGSMPPEEIDALDWRDADARARALLWNQQQIARMQGSTEKKTNWGYYQSLNEMSPQQLLVTQIDPTLLSDTDARYWFKEQKSIRENGASAAVTTMRDDAKVAWKQIQTTDWFDTHLDVGSEQEGQWNQVVNQRYAEFVRQNSREPSTAERQEILRSAVTVFNEQVGGEELAPRIDIPLSEEALQRIRDAIKSQGGDPNDPIALRDMREMLGL